MPATRAHYTPIRAECGRSAPEDVVAEMCRWGRIMGRLRMVPYVSGKGWAGNMGCRDGDVVWVTRSGSEIDTVAAKDIVGLSPSGAVIAFWGTDGVRPTSEWEIYWEIFQSRPDVRAVLHGHDALVLETASQLCERYPEAVLTKSVTESGSAEFRDEVLDILTDATSYLIGRDHGFFALGSTFEKAGLLALDFRSRAIEAMVGPKEYDALLRKYHLR